jgi:hypothetical protein
MTKITVNREALDRWHEALKSLDPHIQQLAVNALRATASQPEQEPVAERFEAMHANGDVWITTIAAAQIARSTTPTAQRPWVGLTEEEFLEACELAERGNYLLAFQRIQTKLKERNT